MSERLDPEELLEVVTTYQSACREIVERHEGHVAKYLGDGVLVFFGYPIAHDDDVQRSVRAALEIVQSMDGLNAGIGYQGTLLQTRIGIHTGPVVAGMLEPGTGEFVVVGSTPNIAARLQDIAVPDSVVVSADSQHLAEGYFRWQDMGEFTLKGIAAPVRAYRPLEASNIRTPFEFAIHKGLRPLVGRADELESLRDRYRRARAGAGQVVRLSGDGGIGKSRLLYAVQQDAEAADGVWLTGRCTEQTRNTAFYPVLEVLRSLFGLVARDSRVDRLRQLEQALVGFDEPWAVHLLASLLSLEPDGDAAPMFSPELQRRRTMETLTALLLHQSRTAPLVITIEDLHWVDPSTLELLDMVTGAIAEERVLVLLSYRPTFVPSPSTAANVTVLSLGPLGAADVRDLVTGVAGAEVMRPAVIDRIVERADGVPLFVEELTRMVLESAEFAPRGSGEPDGVATALSIPSTLESSLRTRLDRLGEAKAVVQLASVLGREFDWMMLASFGLLDDALLERSLGALVAAELLVQTGSPPVAHYAFRHALIRDAAYQSLLKRARRDHHARIAEIAVDHGWDVLVEQPEFVAHHYSEAGLHDQAATHWLRAGQQAIDRSANAEAIAHFTRGLAEVAALPDDRVRQQMELALVMSLGPALNASRGYGSADTERAYTRALELCEEIGDAPELFWVLWGLGAFRQARGQYPEALEKGRQIQQLAESRPELLAEAQFGVGTSLFYLGDITAARHELEKGADFFISQVGTQNVSPTGHHAGVMSLGYLAIALWHLGFAEQAVRRSEQGIDLAASIGHPFARVQSLHWASFVGYLAGDLARTRAWSEEEARLSSEYGFPFGELGSGMTLAWLDAAAGNRDAVERLRLGVNTYRGIGVRVGLTYFLTMLADACLRLDLIDEGLEAIAAGWAEVGETGERAWEAELHRLGGELLAGRDPARAERSLRQAVAVAHEQGARSLELRAAMSLAHLLEASSGRSPVLASIADLYQGFAEGLDTADLRRAALLVGGIGASGAQEHTS